jgi:hypothetical protein
MLDKRYSFEKFKDYIDKECQHQRISLPFWEENYCFLFTPNLKEKKIENLLNYREGASFLVLLDPSMIIDKETKEEVEKILKSLENGFSGSYEEVRKKIAAIKDFVVPVPFWWLKKVDIEERKGFPIVNLKEKLYKREYGIYEASLEDI